jgi:hypothetical protein
MVNFDQKHCIILDVHGKKWDENHVVANPSTCWKNQTFILLPDTVLFENITQILFIYLARLGLVLSHANN